jgi:hypothetical protein
VAKPEAKIPILVGAENASLLLKAVKEITDKERSSKFVDHFSNQNPAAKRLMDEVGNVFDIALTSLAKEVKKVLGDDGQ